MEPSNATKTRRVWLVAAALSVVAVGLAVAAIADLRRAPVPTTSASPTDATRPLLAGAPLRAEPQTARDDQRLLERARRKAVRNAEAAAPGSASRPPQLMSAWSDAFAGKRNSNGAAPPAASALPQVDDGDRGHAARVGPRLQRLAERAHLSPEQIETLSIALRDERARIALLRQQRQDGTLSRDQARGQIDAIRSQTDAQLAHVLDADQLTAFGELRERPARRVADAP